MISVLILTLDEAINIGECIKSLPWRDDVHVLDSGSSDLTREIAENLGAIVSIRTFSNYSDQRNFGLALSFAYEWIVMIDADERITESLAREIEESIAVAENNTDMFLVRRKDIFMGRWLRRSSGYPTWFPRVFRKNRVCVEREINETYNCNGRKAELSGHLLHYPFNKGMDWWFERHGHYSSEEARLLVQMEQKRSIEWQKLFSSDRLIRRATLKHVFYRLPGRPFLTFIFLYFVRLGFLDGLPGYHFAIMRMSYEVMIDAKVAYSRFKNEHPDL